MFWFFWSNDRHLQTLSLPPNLLNCPKTVLTSSHNYIVVLSLLSIIWRWFIDIICYYSYSLVTGGYLSLIMWLYMVLFYSMEFGDIEGIDGDDWLAWTTMVDYCFFFFKHDESTLWLFFLFLVYLFAFLLFYLFSFWDIRKTFWIFKITNKPAERNVLFGKSYMNEAFVSMISDSCSQQMISSLVV